MRKTPIALLLAAWVLMACSAVRADERDFTIHNKTGYPIKFIGVNPIGDNDYNENELEGVLANGASIKVKFDPGTEKGHKTYNIKVVWADDGTVSYFKNIDLTKIDNLTLHYNKSTDAASYTTDE